MHASSECPILEKLDEGVVVKQIDDFCFVHVSRRGVDALQTRELGEKLISFIEEARCRKLVMTFDGVESIYGFSLENPPLPRPLVRAERTPAGSDLWLG